MKEILKLMFLKLFFFRNPNFQGRGGFNGAAPDMNDFSDYPTDSSDFPGFNNRFGYPPPDGASGSFGNRGGRGGRGGFDSRGAGMGGQRGRDAAFNNQQQNAQKDLGW